MATVWDQILSILGFKATVHKPCLYSGVIQGERFLVKQQVDDFEVAVPNERIANILFDAIDDLLTFPLKRMGKDTQFNGIDVLQTRHYIKISVKTYISRVCEKHLASWMDMGQCPTYMTPLPNKPSFTKLFLSSVGNPDEKSQRELAKKMGFGF